MLPQRTQAATLQVASATWNRYTRSDSGFAAKNSSCAPKVAFITDYFKLLPPGQLPFSFPSSTLAHIRTAACWSTENSTANSWFDPTFVLTLAFLMLMMILPASRVWGGCNLTCWQMLYPNTVGNLVLKVHVSISDEVVLHRDLEGWLLLVCLWRHFMRSLICLHNI